ncbi:hypothetical protein KR51_00027740 [Rubidibacter lacunae KORDI 51-2]|uniref:DUF948 domain-containing protein n=1 Tax=Rubidibacter lacunae KORDI 51-2 TaxID=582515 RepID=U5DM41_9CHRO|nr:hypothetical protein [Rubidibacter lacunae]ERN40785.1 hypothetical protein KR51_00027740 [Rubidibacter lacunae KORDI 51-2]
MQDPFFWLGLSLLLVAVSLTAVLAAALPAVLELARAARSAEKLFDVLQRELPPTLAVFQETGKELGELGDEVNAGVKGASELVQQVGNSAAAARQQATTIAIGTRGVAAGIRAAWRAWQQPVGTAGATGGPRNGTNSLLENENSTASAADRERSGIEVIAKPERKHL